jgi:hypothetical protein
MKWTKLGLVFCPSGETDWMQSHASVPIAERLGGDRFKIYFSSRDKFNRSFTGYVVIDINHPNQILELSAAPILVPEQWQRGLPTEVKTNIFITSAGILASLCQFVIRLDWL